MSMKMMADIAMLYDRTGEHARLLNEIIERLNKLESRKLKPGLKEGPKVG